MGWNHTGMIMATKKKQPRKRGGNKTRAPETAPPSGLGGGWEKMASGYPAREPADAGRPNLQQIPLPKNYFPLVETFIGALGAAFATRAFRHLTEPRRLVVFVGHIGMHSGAPVLHVTDELERTEDGRVLARPLCSPEHVSPAMKAWPVTRLKTTHDALTAGAHWCHRCEELAKVQVEEFAKRRAESFAAGGGIIGPTVKHEPPTEAPIGPERAQMLMDDLDATSAMPPHPNATEKLGLDADEFEITLAKTAMIEKPALCSRCGTAPKIYRRSGLYRVRCPTCRYTTLRFGSLTTPIMGWNRSNPAPKPTVSAAAMEAADVLSRELGLRGNDPTVKPGQVYEDLRTGIRVVVGAENNGSWNMTYLDDAGGYTIPPTDLLDQTKFRRLFKFSHLWQHEPDTTDRRVSQSCDDCSFVGTRNGEPACNLDDRVLPMDAGPAPDWCRLRQGPVLVTLEEK